ncbi:hypothetical protein [Rubellicoccus peritrichatus]|uniref:Uncharacterized protein n=1 Tax=Rubellicoccus peritrichatus TaxID=3080537 RepID=A0AAQ3L589_9BACT|nr:hypothetical protein [Puniceicoccus sp. CR14]WOO39644.1 hypothetical protein RZN69_13555 [Puniceicoccus sp. CR14]
MFIAERPTRELAIQAQALEGMDNSNAPFVGKPLDSFDQVMRNVIDVINFAEDNLTIATDVAPFGCISEPDLYESYKSSLKTISENNKTPTDILWMSSNLENSYISQFDSLSESDIKKVSSESYEIRNLFPGTTEVDSPWLIYLNFWSAKKKGQYLTVITWISKPTDEDAPESVKGIVTASPHVAAMTRDIFNTMLHRKDHADVPKIIQIFSNTE